ncbi:MAG: 2-oxoacid:ferredoxin oxidoreductase subunit gamma [Armatimonadetes bacterium]|jgi:2-oxoglutarate ferredoxin oxidoreductase subunit gamma|nr:2-oxoacid:ferredoxin oxidoreductase subunit gamma [Armatimonadota bacterium]
MLKRQEVKIVGMGGQGIMVIGQLLAHAALIEGANVVWFPCYGPETRGGLAECTVIISSDEIGSPVTSTPDTLIAMTQPLLDKFAPTVKPGGVIFVNTSLAQPPKYRDDCKIVEIPANDIATELSNPKTANMVMLGGYVELMKPVKLESLKASLKEVLPEHNHRFIPINNTALDKGAEVTSR